MANFRGGWKDQYALLTLLLAQADVRMSDVQVMRAIFTRYNIKDGFAWPSNDELMSMTGISKSQVRRAVVRLEGWELLGVEPWDGHKSKYFPNWEAIDDG